VRGAIPVQHVVAATLTVQRVVDETLHGEGGAYRLRRGARPALVPDRYRRAAERLGC
jgi:hypothetical protein